MVNNKEASQTRPRANFEVGNYVLQARRTCEQTRQHLGLSNREIELLMCIGSGLKKHEIAARMGVSASTADTFRRRAYAKLGVTTASAAVAIMVTYMAGSNVKVAPSPPIEAAELRV